MQVTTYFPNGTIEILDNVISFDIKNDKSIQIVWMDNSYEQPFQCYARYEQFEIQSVIVSAENK